MLRDKLTELLRSFFDFLGISRSTGFIAFGILVIIFAIVRLRKWKELEDGDKGLTLASIFLMLFIIFYLYTHS